MVGKIKISFLIINAETRWHDLKYDRIIAQGGENKKIFKKSFFLAKGIKAGFPHAWCLLIRVLNAISSYYTELSSSGQLSSSLRLY